MIFYMSDIADKINSCPDSCDLIIFEFGNSLKTAENHV